MQRKAEEAGARVLDASRESITAACFLVCNFAAAFTHLSRLSGSSAAGHLSGGQEDPQQLLAALEVEPLRLLTPFWLFACLRDGRVYAPDAHALFRVSTALTHTQPPLWQLQQPLQVYHHLPHSQRVLLLGFTRRLRRVRRPRSFACGVLSSDSDEGNKEGHRPEAAGRALAANDMEMAVACVEALGGSCLSVSSVLRAVEERSLGPPAATAEADAATDTWDRLGVDVVIVGHFSRLRKANTALLGKGPALHEAGTQQVRVNTQQRERRHGAKAELALLYKLQELGVPCVHHQWLIDAYCFGRAPPFDVYAIPTEPAPQIEVPAAPSAAARRQQVLQGVQVLVADSEVTRDPSLLRRIGELGCTDVTAIPSLLGICPWLFSCGATRELAAVLCGCGDRVQCVSAALERAEEARKRSWENFAAVLFVIKREDLAGLLDLAAVAAEAVEATASSQRLLEGAPTGRAASTRSAQRQQAAPLQHDPQQQKIRNLISAAQQQVLQQLPTAMASQAQRFWEEATNVAVRPVAADAAAFVAKRDIPALAARGPLAVSPEWIASCWAEARRVPVDSAHGRIEASMNCMQLLKLPMDAAPEFWADALASDSAGHMEDAALLAALQDCGGTVIYGDFPVVTDVKEARLRRAVGALEHALTISWDIQQDRFLEQSH
ncbi:hypothetical protein, conserved [Eimeria praecox]|uniref:BRCT domain-containing protein n=1 Tax=Eimeria praecox TaxID=51316 RepID=U6GZ07_9EIME|nr:hypothetical protein, conserved [Eimeria praecox]